MGFRCVDCLLLPWLSGEKGTVSKEGAEMNRGAFSTTTIGICYVS